jgi:type IV secretion system protein VirB1
MSVAAVALSTLLQQCAPNVGERTMTAIVRVESNAYPLAIYDNTSRRSFSPRTVPEALYTARVLIDAGHSVDLGLAQVNSANLPRLGMAIRDAFDPCSNLRGAATILSSDYDDAASHFSPGPYALRRAIGAYNSGSIYGGDTYIDRILVAAGLPPQGSRKIPDLEPTGYGPGANVTLPGPTLASAPASHAAPVVVHVKPVVHKPAVANPFAAPILVMSAQPSPPETLLQQQSASASGSDASK